MDNFTPIPNWISDHLADGRMNPNGFAIYYYLLRTCTWKTGAWRGTAERIRYGLNEELSVSQINRYLSRMDACNYIIRTNVPGARGSYVILINNYAHDDEIIRPIELKDWRELTQTHAQGDAYEMRMRCVGDAQHDACEMRSNPDILNVPDTPNLPNIPDVPDKRSKLVSERVTEAGASSNSAPAEKPTDHATKSHRSDRLGRNLTQEEWEYCEEAHYKAFKLEPLDDPRDSDIITFAEVAMDMKERYGGEPLKLVEEFLTWQKKHKPEKFHNKSGVELAKTWFSESDHSGRRQWRDHNEDECKLCVRGKDKSKPEYRNVSKYGGFMTADNPWDKPKAKPAYHTEGISFVTDD